MQKDKLKEFISREGKKYDGMTHQSQRKMKIKQLENMEEIELIEDEAEGSLIFPMPSGVFNRDEVLIGVDCATFGWKGEEEPLFEDVDFVVMPKSRIGIIGKNGCG
jgi:ATPase subunit of ABC transporter with duplicated ATPase domains